MKRLREGNHQEDYSDNSSSSNPIQDSTFKKQVVSESSNYLLGYKYLDGEDGVEKDYSKAFDYFSKGAEEGCIESMLLVGYCYDEGYGVQQDYTKAMEWYLKSFKGGNESAQFNIGLCYEKGKGVEQDYVNALELYRKAAEHGENKAQNRIGRFYEVGEAVEKDKSKAFEWYLKAAVKGYMKAQYNIGRLYQSGKGVQQNYYQSFKWFLKAAENERGYHRAQKRIGSFYYSGFSVEKDYSKAMEWYLKAAKNCSLDAQYYIGIMYENGHGVERSLSQAFSWNMKAAENGYKRAQREIGLLFKKGNGVEKDLNKSFYWMTKGLNGANFKVIEFNEFGIEEFKNDDIIETNTELTLHESDNELISKVIIRFNEKDFSISSNNLSNSKYLTTIMNQNWRNFNQTEGDQIILDFTSIENEIFEQETDHIQIFEIYFNYLLNNEFPIDFKLDLKLKLIELSRYLADDKCILQILKQSCLLTRYYILFKFEKIQPIHNMIASCFISELPLIFYNLAENEFEMLLNESELSTLAKRAIHESFFKKFNKYPNSTMFNGKFQREFTTIL